MKWRNDEMVLHGKSQCGILVSVCKGLPLQLLRANHGRVSDIQANLSTI